MRHSLPRVIARKTLEAANNEALVDLLVDPGAVLWVFYPQGAFIWPRARVIFCPPRVRVTPAFESTGDGVEADRGEVLTRLIFELSRTDRSSDLICNRTWLLRNNCRICKPQICTRAPAA